MRLVSTMAVALLLVSCSGKKDEAKTDASPMPMEPPRTFTMAPTEMENPTNIVVSVDGELLRLGELNTETQIRLSNMGGANMGPETLAQMRGLVMEQFVTRTLLLNEAKSRKIEVSEDDLKAELAKIQEMIPDGMTVEQIINESPLGRETMLDHIRKKIVIDKLSEVLMKDKVEVSDKEVEEFIKENQAALTIPETVEARHILIKFDPTDDDKVKEEKKAKLEKLRKDITDGADFEEVAKANSDCPSGQMGGFLGKFAKKDMVPEFAEAAFSQKIGEVGKIVTTQFGHHIIKVEKHEDESTYPREEIEARIRDIKMQSVMMEFIKELRSKADIKTFSS